MFPDPRAGLDPSSRAYAVACLRKLSEWAGSARCDLPVAGQRLVGGARVPLLKLALRAGPEVGAGGMHARTLYCTDARRRGVCRGGVQRGAADAPAARRRWT